MKKGVFFFATFLLFTYPSGLWIGIVFWLLVLVGALRIKGWENFPKQGGKILLVGNHPTLLEPILLIGLFLSRFWCRPGYGPYTMADQKTYFKGWKRPFYWILWPRLIEVDRTKADNRESLDTARRLLASGANIVMFPGGGRDNKGNSHRLVCVNRRLKMLRRFKHGFAILATEPGVTTIPVWFEYNHWYDMRLVIGRSIRIVDRPRDELVRLTEKIILKLAERAG